ncbi:MAG: hypothetical protein ABIL25_05475 [candidate division WOR-3 bacterium]
MERMILIAVCASAGLSSAQIAWTKAADLTGWQWRVHMGVANFDDRLWLLGGWDLSLDYNDIWYTTDGAEWTRAVPAASWRPRWGHATVVHSGKVWIFGGAYYQAGTKLLADVWYSSDCMNWIQATSAAPWGPRGHTQVVSFRDTLWLLGGWLRPDTQLYANDVWCSTDGANWTRVTEDAGWTRRTGHRVEVFNNRIWVVGGYSDRPNNDVWYSEDGRTWTQATANAPWSARQYHQLLVLDNRLWVLGGRTPPTTYFRDVWYSSNGTDWVAANDTAPWPQRANHGGAVYHNRLWVLGGYNGSALGDVWYSHGLGLEEKASLGVETMGMMTIVRDVLFRPEVPGAGPRAPGALLDASGRNVLHLKPGTNDVSRLAPGIYFIRAAGYGASAGSCQKAIVVR